MNKQQIKKNNKKNQTTKEINTKVRKDKHLNLKKLTPVVNLFFLLLFIATALYYMPVLNKNVFFRIQELSIFIPTKYYFTEMIQVPGGFLAWLGTFFTQFFFYPWLGTSIFILLVLLTQFLIVRAFKIPAAFLSLTFVFAFAMLLIATGSGYLIFSLKVQGHIFSTLVGFAAVALAFWAYRKMKTYFWRSLFSVLFVLLFYPVLGFYALFSAVLFVVYELVLFVRTKNKGILLPLFSAVLVAVFIPRLMYNFIYLKLATHWIYLSGLPDFSFSNAEKVQWIPYLTVIAFMLLCFLILFRKNKSELGLKSLILIAFVNLSVLYGFTQLTFDDENYRTEIAMSLSIYENRWEDVLKLARDNNDEPTRMIVMCTNLALQKLNRAGDEMFTFSDGDKHPASPWPMRLVVLNGKQFYYQYGKSNYCYHWAMEDMVERGMRVDYIRYMVKCALIKGELQLANKYNSVLHKTLFYKEWAQKYQQYIDQPRKMLEDKEFKQLQPLTAYDNKLFGNNGVMELEILNEFAYSESINMANMDIAIQSTLILRNSSLFWPRFFIYVQTHDRIPKHYQEAAIMFSYFEKKVNVSHIKFDQEVVDRFNQLLKMTEKYYNNSNEVNKKLFKPTFGDTYWYYYFFVKNIETV